MRCCCSGGERPAVRARRRLPGRAAGAVRSDAGRAGPSGQGGARRPGVRAGSPLPARRGHPVRRRDRRLVQARPGGRGAAGRRVHRVLRRALHGRDRPTSSPRPSQQVVLPDLAAGCSMADMAGYQQVRRRLGRAGRRRCRRRHGPGHLHELLRRHQGVHRRARRHGLHVVQRRAARCAGRFAARARRCCSCPTSTWAATPRCASWACR